MPSPIVAELAARALEVLDEVANSTSPSADAPEEDECAASLSTSHWGLRIGAIFIILATSVFGTLLPILLRQSNVVPRAAFE